MIRIEQRPIEAEEMEALRRRTAGFWQRGENFVLKMVLVVPVLLAPMLVYDAAFPVRSEIQAIWCVAVLILSAVIVQWLTKRFATATPVYGSGTMVEVVHVETSRAVRREDPEDFGVAYYLDVNDRGQSKTLYLWGQYLDMLEFDESGDDPEFDLEKDQAFPSTRFQFVRLPGSAEFLEFVVTGHYLAPELSLPAFSEAVWKRGDYPVNGALLPASLDEIIAIG